MSKEEKLMVLQMVAEGKITPEQGAELLRAVGEGKPEAPAAAAAPKATPAPAPKVTVVTKGPGQQVEEIGENIQRTIERATRRAEEVAQKATAHAEQWASQVEKHAEDIARLGESGANLGKVLGESGQNLGKILSNIFGTGFSGGPRFEFHEEMRGELPAEGEMAVSLSTTNGRITIDTWDEKGYRLDVRKTSNAATEEEAKEATKNGFEFKQDGLNIQARSKEIGSGFNLLRQYTIGFTLTLPRDRKASLDLSSSNGRIAIGGVSGSRLHATTSNGRVEAEGCNFADTELGSANGRIEFEGRPGNLSASTANGRISAHLGGLGNWKLNSANGRVEVEIRKEPGAAYGVEASTVMGKIDVQGMEDAEVLVNESKHKIGSRRYQARTRGYSDAPSKASLYASTTNGKVTIGF